VIAGKWSRCLSLSEPDVYTNLLRFGDAGERYIVPVSRFLFKPTPSKVQQLLLPPLPLQPTSVHSLM